MIHSACLLREINFSLRVLRPLLTFDMDLKIGDQVFYTRSTGLRVPAKVVGHSDEGYVELEYHQDGVRVVNHRCPVDALSFGIPSWDSPPPFPLSRPAAMGVSEEISQELPPHMPSDETSGSPIRGKLGG